MLEEGVVRGTQTGERSEILRGVSIQDIYAILDKYLFTTNELVL